MSTAVAFEGWWAIAGEGRWQQGGVPADVRVVYVLDATCNTTAEVTGTIDGRPWRWRDGERSIVHLPAALELGAQVGPWEGLGPRELLAAFEAFERLCGVPWGDSVGRTAEALILSGHPRVKGGRRLDMAPDVPEPARDNALELPYNAWRRELTAAERAAEFVHMFDANAQYLGAWGTTELGHGRPIHHRAPAFDAGRVGVWRLEGVDNLRLPFGLLPPPWTENRDWYTTPTVVRMLEVCEGYAVPTVVEAFIWPERSRFLRPAGERLRDARKAALDELGASRAALLGPESSVLSDDAMLDRMATRIAVAESVRQAVSLLYQVETGRFGMGARDPRSGWARPDWGNFVRAQARVNLHRRLYKLTQAPFAIATDGLLFATDEEDAGAFAERIGLPLGQGLGQYKYEATAELSHVGVDQGVGKLFEQVAQWRE